MTRALIATSRGLFRWGGGACENIVAAGTPPYRGVSTADGITWFISGGWSNGHLHRYVWGGAFDDLGFIGTSKADLYAEGVHALSSVRCLVACSTPYQGGTVGGVREYDNGAEYDHTPEAEMSWLSKGTGAIYVSEWLTGEIRKWPGSGTVWSSVAPALSGYPTERAESMAALSDSQIWIGGLNTSDSKGRIWFWNGASWATQWTAPSTGSAVYGIVALSASDVWACDAAGNILHFDGTSWSVVFADAAAAFRCIGALSPTEVYAVADMGDSSRLYLFSGAAPTSVVVDGFYSTSIAAIALFASAGPPLNVGPYWLLNDDRDNELTNVGDLRREDEITTRCRLRLLCRRGEWFADSDFGSRLHTLQVTGDTQRDADDYVREALAPLVDEGAIVEIHVGRVETNANGLIAIPLQITVPDERVIDLVVPAGGNR